MDFPFKRKRDRDELDRERSKKEKGESIKVRQNQEWSNLTSSEKRGLKKLKNRIKKGEIVIEKIIKNHTRFWIKNYKLRRESWPLPKDE